MTWLFRATWLTRATMSSMNHGTMIGTGDVGKLGLLVDDRDLGRDLVGVVRADLGTEAVLQRRDESTAVGVVLGVRRRDDQHVEVEAHEVAADLHVALFEDVEQSDLDALGQVGQLVHGEDAAVGLGHEPVGERLGVVEEQSARRP